MKTCFGYPYLVRRLFTIRFVPLQSELCFPSCDLFVPSRQQFRLAQFMLSIPTKLVSDVEIFSHTRIRPQKYRK